MFRDLGAVAPFEVVRGIEACGKVGRGNLAPRRSKIAVWRRAAGAAAFRSRALHPPMAFYVVGNGGEMDLALGLGEPDPSHRAKM
jgi:hypothetical protein